MVKIAAVQIAGGVVRFLPLDDRPEHLDGEVGIVRRREPRHPGAPTLLLTVALAALSGYMKGADVLIHVSLGCGDALATVWGCDLTDGYVRINAEYTT